MLDTKIISAFPCLGKTFFAEKNKETSIDLESSNYFFDKTGFESLSAEEFKGLKNRTKRENGLKSYLTAIDEAVKSNKYKYVFISQNPEVVKGILKLGYKVHLVKPNPGKESEKEFIKRAIKRGNNMDWINSTIPYLSEDLESYYSEDEFENLLIYFLPYDSYLSDLIASGLI